VLVAALDRVKGTLENGLKASERIAGAPLALQSKIPLGEVSGRIDHLAIDPKRQRLFVAELGNNSVGVVDLAAGKVMRRIDGLSEPQGVHLVTPYPYSAARESLMAATSTSAVIIGLPRQAPVIAGVWRLSSA
jgi:hypothetical protein